MTSTSSDPIDLFAVAEALDGVLDDSAAGAGLQADDAAALIISDGVEVAVREDFGSGADERTFEALFDALREKLADVCECDFHLSSGGDEYRGVGISRRIGTKAISIGALFRASDSPSGDRRETALDTLSIYLTRAVLRGKDREDRLRTRLKHLKAEHETLKASQTQAVASAIEEREKRLQQQRDDLEQMEALMRFAADGMMTVGQDGTVESFNKAACRIFEYEPDEVIGRHVSMLAPDPNERSHGVELADVVLKPDVHAARGLRETVGRRKDGATFPLEVGVGEVPLEFGQVFSVIFRDIEDRKRCESQLVQAQKMESIGQLAAGIAHEINTPTQFVGDNTRFMEDAFQDLAPLLNNCRKLRETRLRGEELDQLIEEMAAAVEQADLEYLVDEIPQAISQSLEGVERVAKIVRSMKDFSHPMMEGKQAIDLNRALESTTTVCRNEWKYVADVVTDLDPTLPLVTCIPGECNQVFLNLIINAAHAVGDRIAEEPEEKGIIGVSSRRDGDWVEIRISDNGTGIPPSHRSRVFDPFFTTKQVGRGTGQGLAIAHTVVTEKHGGTIDFETKTGEGTTFVVRLPISGESPPADE